MEAERKQKRENEVTMYRRYRIGDLPDIQIPYSAIIAPLQALAHVCMSGWCVLVVDVDVISIYLPAIY